MSDLADGPLTATRWLTAWRSGAFGIALAVLLAAPYCWMLLRARRRGIRWPWWRVATYLVGGVGSLVYVTCGVVGVYRQTFLWMFALQVAVIGTVTPVGLAVGDPLRLLEAASGNDTPVHRILRSRSARLLAFPAVSFVLDLAGIIAVFFTGYGDSAVRSPLVGAVLIVQLLVVGLLFVLPVIAGDLLPDWATPPVRTLLAFLDGVADAVPGVLVMTAGSTLLPRFPGFQPAASAARRGMSTALDQRYAGGALLAVAEAVGVPILAACFVEWVRADAAEARQTDAELDRPAGPRTDRGTPDDADPHEGTDSGRPWWLDDPRLADRFGRRDD